MPNLLLNHFVLNSITLASKTATYSDIQTWGAKKPLSSKECALRNLLLDPFDCQGGPTMTIGEKMFTHIYV